MNRYLYISTLFVISIIYLILMYVGVFENPDNIGYFFSLCMMIEGVHQLRRKYLGLENPWKNAWTGLKHLLNPVEGFKDAKKRFTEE